MEQKAKDCASRRKFLKQISAGTLSIALANKLIPAFANSPFPTPVGGNKSKVIIIKHSNAVDANGVINQPLIQEMINRGMTEFTGKETLVDAWSQFFRSEELVSLKINTLGLDSLFGTNYIQHFTGISSAIVSGLQQINIMDKNILIWERSDEELINGGYTIQREEGKMRIMGTRPNRKGENEGFHPEQFPVGNSTTRVHTYITDLSTSFINIPVLKTHGIAGISGSLKNHYGSIDNPRDFHPNNATNPGIPEINAIPVIREKQKLIIADALLGVFDDGPRWNRDKLWVNNEIIIGTDPVAVDTVMMRILNRKRESEELEPLDFNAIHLSLSEELGLGNHKLSNIDIQEIVLG
ncbi:MAG: DUF362 domain-containing protein [Bacteroidales bacterium]